MNKALLVGINKYPSAPLNGCVNDVKDMANFLVSKCQFTMDNVRLLTDERATTTAIIDRLGWLLNGTRAGDRVLFHYSGHGAQLPTRNPQGEIDGLDEVICPVDFDWTDEHTIRDKDFNRIFSAIPEGVEFVWVSDSCHSGDLFKLILLPKTKIKTITPPADIEWRIETAKSKLIKPLGLKEVASSLNLALIAGCKSDQTSADAFINNRYNGALSYFLLQELASTDGLQESLVQAVNNLSAQMKKDPQGFTQEPQLEGNEHIKSRAFLKAS